MGLDAIMCEVKPYGGSETADLWLHVSRPRSMNSLESWHFGLLSKEVAGSFKSRNEAGVQQFHLLSVCTTLERVAFSFKPPWARIWLWQQRPERGLLCVMLWLWVFSLQSCLVAGGITIKDGSEPWSSGVGLAVNFLTIWGFSESRHLVQPAVERWASSGVHIWTWSCTYPVFQGVSGNRFVVQVYLIINDDSYNMANSFGV